MSAVLSEDLKALGQRDETAWLERSALLIREGRLDELDYEGLGDFLEAMAKRDRREVESRLAVLLAHLLKWTYQPDRRNRGWRVTVEVQRHELDLLLRSGTLRNHAEAELASAYLAAQRQAAAETGISPKAFPQHCPYTVQQLLEIDLPEGEA
jgi:hypothetical protein